MLTRLSKSVNIKLKGRILLFLAVNIPVDDKSGLNLKGDSNTGNVTEIEPELVIKEISSLKQQFTQYGGARPFGVSMMILGMQDGKGKVYVSDVTGNYFEYYANAIGENDSKLKEKLREKYKKDLTLKQGIKLAVEIFKEIKDDKFDLDKFEVAYIENEEQKIKRLEGKEILELK